MFKPYSKMDKTQKRQAAGETATTKKGWGFVACIGAMVAVTMGDSITMAGIGAAMLALGAWLGGYMSETVTKAKSALRQAQGPETTERRAA